MIRLWELLWHGCWHDWRFSTTRKLVDTNNVIVGDEAIYVCDRCQRVKSIRL